MELSLIIGINANYFAIFAIIAQILQNCNIFAKMCKFLLKMVLNEVIIAQIGHKWPYFRYFALIYAQIGHKWPFSHNSLILAQISHKWLNFA